MVKRILSVFIAAAAIISCSRNPITGRNQLKLFPESELQAMASTQYQQFLSTNRVVTGSNNRDVDMTRRVGQRITRAVTDYYSSKGELDQLKGYNWEYNLVDDKAVNAWCMPG